MAPEHIKSPEDLVTPHKEVCAGFLAQAKAKTEEARPYIDEALTFWRVIQDLEKAEDIADLFDEHREALLAVAGFSTKSLNNLRKLFSEDGLTDLLRDFFREFSEANFKEEIFARYLLTKGDSLGGTMRNVVGAWGKERFKEALIAELNDRQLAYEVKEYNGKVRGIEWKTGRKIKVEGKKDLLGEREVDETRLVVFDATPSQLQLAIAGEPDLEADESEENAEANKEKAKKNNVDIITLNSTSMPKKVRGDGKESKAAFDRRRKLLFSTPSNYLACGELKSGIDPAGADEHFKTAGSAIGRLRSRFREHGIDLKLFIVAAAVAKAMAEEIFEDLENGNLSYAANFTNREQVEDLMSWMVSL